MTLTKRNHVKGIEMSILESNINKQCAKITDIGRIRKLNEDSLHCGDNLWVVADGMGGHACGDVASQLAIKVIVDQFTKSANLVNAIELAHEKVLEAGQKGEGQKGMGTTVVALTCVNDEFEIAWVGDSRAYLWQPQQQNLAALTTDHSLVAGMVQKGIISEKQARLHPQRNMITRCLGSKKTATFEVDKCQGLWQPDQQILLCSDGLSDEICESQMVELLLKAGSKGDKLEQMVDAAKDAGGRDNISAILIDSPVTAP